MQVEEYDFAIYGSGLDAAFLGAELVKRQDCRVILIRDHVNDYSLDHHQQYSAAGITDPETIAEIARGLDNFHLHFSGKTGRECYDRTQLALKVSSAERSDLLHYIEGALIASDQLSERKAARNGEEFLLLRDVIAPKRRESLEFLVRAFVGVGMEVYDRSEFDQARQFKDGRLSLKARDKKISAAQLIVLDEDLIDQHVGEDFRQQVQPVIGTKMKLQTVTRYTKPPVCYVDTGFTLFAAKADTVFASAPMNYDAFVRHAKREFVGIEQLSIIAQGAFHQYVTHDGSPILHFAKETKTWVFVGSSIASLFLMPSISDQLCEQSEQTGRDFWATRSVKNRKCADIALMPYSAGGSDARF